jgi:hypothetical protein
VRLDARQLSGEHSRQGAGQIQTIGHYPTGALTHFGPGLTRLDARQLSGEHSRQGAGQIQTIGHYPTGALTHFGPGLTLEPPANPARFRRLLRDNVGIRKNVSDDHKSGYEGRDAFGDRGESTLTFGIGAKTIKISQIAQISTI